MSPAPLCWNEETSLASHCAAAPECHRFITRGPSRKHQNNLSCPPAATLDKLNDQLFSTREQMNFGTAYLDGSGVYGATPESADKLREFKRGFLKVQSSR